MKGSLGLLGEMGQSDLQHYKDCVDYQVAATEEIPAACSAFLSPKYRLNKDHFPYLH